MVARLTIKKKGFEHVVERMRAIADECDDERWALLALADRDAEAYQDVMAAYKLPKATPEDERTWAATLQSALERAADIPLEVARRSVYLMSLAEETLANGNPNAASDALSAATSLHAATLSALANVDINAITFLDKTRQQELAGLRELAATPRTVDPARCERGVPDRAARLSAAGRACARGRVAPGSSRADRRDRLRLP